MRNFYYIKEKFEDIFDIDITIQFSHPPGIITINQVCKFTLIAICESKL